MHQHTRTEQSILEHPTGTDVVVVVVAVAVVVVVAGASLPRRAHLAPALSRSLAVSLRGVRQGAQEWCEPAWYMCYSGRPKTPMVAVSCASASVRATCQHSRLAQLCVCVCVDRHRRRRLVAGAAVGEYNIITLFANYALLNVCERRGARVWIVVLYCIVYGLVSPIRGGNTIVYYRISTPHLQDQIETDCIIQRAECPSHRTACSTCAIHLSAQALR